MGFPRRGRQSSQRSLDDRLAQAARQGGKAAAAELILELRPWLVRYASMQNYPNHTEEFIQEAFIEIFRSLNRYEPNELPSPITPWARTIARNTIRDLIRRLEVRSSEVVSTDLVIARAASQGASVEKVALLTALNSLSEEQQELLYRRHLYGELLDEIAHELDIPRTTLVRRLKEAEAEFRRRMGEGDE